MNAEQPSLFPELEQTATPKRSRGRFLADVAELARLFEQSNELSNVISQAVAAATPDKTQAWGNRVEAEVGKLLSQKAVADKVACDLVKVSQSWQAGVLRWCRIEVVGGTSAPQDLLFRLTFSDDSRFVMMINLKALATETTSYGNGVSLSTFLRMATEPDFDPTATGFVRGYDPDLAILELLAGTRKILPGREYFILHIQTTDGLDSRSVVSWHFQGLLSHVTTDNKPCVYRHPSRDVVQVVKASSILPPGYDINREIALALMPAHRPGALRSRVGAALADGGRLGRSTAERLLTMSDDEILARLVGQGPPPLAHK